MGAFFLNSLLLSLLRHEFSQIHSKRIQQQNNSIEFIYCQIESDDVGMYSVDGGCIEWLDGITDEDVLLFVFANDNSWENCVSIWIGLKNEFWQCEKNFLFTCSVVIVGGLERFIPDMRCTWDWGWTFPACSQRLWVNDMDFWWLGKSDDENREKFWKTNEIFTIDWWRFIE